MPNEPWLSRAWLRGWIEKSAPAIAQLPSLLGHPLVSRMLPGGAAANYLRLWEERERFLDALDRLTQVFCHRDAFARNILAPPDPDGPSTITLIDWGGASTGAIGIVIWLLTSAPPLRRIATCPPSTLPSL